MSDINYMDNIPTFVALPLNSLQNNEQKPEQFRIIKNALIKTLSDGSLCIMDADDYEDNLQQSQIEISYLPTLNNTQPVNTPTEKLQTNDNSAPKTQNSIYKCPKCKEVFDKIASYRKHMIWHRNVKKFKCEKCAAGYNVEINLKIHMAMHAEGKPTCPICNVSFQRLASLKSHLMIHHVEELYTCEECAAEFEREEELNKHLLNHLNNTVQESNNLVCSYCNVQFEDRKSYKEHITHHIKVKKMVLSGKKSRKTNGTKNYPHVCSVCLKSFSKLSLLERHLRVHSGERPYICPHCNKGFNQKGTLQIHLSKHTGIKPYQCTLCSAKFNQKGNLRVHVEKTHTAPMPGVDMFKCPHCTCIFKKIASLNVHIAKYHATSEEQEDINSVMSRLKELEQHTIITPEMQEREKEVREQNKKVLNEVKKSDVRNTSYVRLAESFLDGSVRRYLVMQTKINDIKYYVCTYCHKEFKKPSDVIRHTRVHTREKPFVCKQCGASFSLKSTLFYHIKTHIGNTHGYSTYACAVCMKKFTSARSLNMHLRKHADRPQYKCVPCNKWFTSAQRARAHDKEKHEDPLQLDLEPLVATAGGLVPVIPQKTTKDANKQNPCPTCGIKFAKLTNLKRHMLLHTGERNYKCNYCPRTYITAHGLSEHLLYHAGVKNFSCKQCGKKFITSSLLKRHMMGHNPSKPYVCPYCNKNFRTLMLCRKHMNVHGKEVNLQVHAFNDNWKIKNRNDVEKNKSRVSATSYSHNTLLTLNSENNHTQTHNTTLDTTNNFQLVPENHTLNSDNIQNQLDQQLYQVPSNSIQIITNSDNSDNQVQIFINCDDLQLTDNLYSQNNADSMLFNTLTDLQDNSTFNVDTINTNFDPQNVEICNTNEINEQIQPINVADLTNKVLKLNNINISPNASKSKPDKLNTVNFNDTLSFYSQPELNLLFSLDPDLSNCDLPNENLNLPDINLNEVPTLNVEPRPENTNNVQEQEQEEDNQKTKKPIWPFCTKCNKHFTNRRTFMKHLQTHRDKKKLGITMHSCSFCEKSFKKHSDLIRHIRTHTGEKPFACDKCEKKFSLKSTLLSHQKTHNPTSQKEFSCVVCNSFFSSKSSLKVHTSVHTGDKSHKCNFCPMKFRTAAHRKSHENSCHINSSKKRMKSKVTNLLASVAMDVLSQQDPNSLQDEQLISSADLNNVLVVQEQMQFSGESLNLLNDSNQATISETAQLDPSLIFQQLQSNILLQDNLIPSSLIQLDDGTLLNVKAINTEQEENIDIPCVQISEKPRNFECDICHKKYASKDVLRRHKKIHGIDKKFRCTKCEKGFDTEEEMKTHEKIHEGFRPYSCLYCANSFSKEHSLNTHVKRIHNLSLKDFSGLFNDSVD